MLVEIQRLNITNDGYKREVSIDKIYVNTDHIVSVSDYKGVNQFLLAEGLVGHQEDKFSLLKILSSNKVEELIVLGTSGDLFSKFNKTSGRRLLND